MVDDDDDDDDDDDAGSVGDVVFSLKQLHRAKSCPPWTGCCCEIFLLHVSVSLYCDGSRV